VGIRGKEFRIMQTFKVYLAGPITGQTFQGASSWREYATEKLADAKSYDEFGVVRDEASKIIAYSPMRAKGYLERMVGMPEHHKGEVKTPLSQILHRDHWDCMTSDAILVNLLDVERVSIGTVMEVAWGYAYKKPVILVTNVGNIHRHGLITQSVGWETDNLDIGIQMVKNILLP
jgi:nucleoside 2-deoxyribosyltransferase